MTKKQAVITIDGPAGAGKSTLARSLAERLGFVYLDTGAIYRTVALAAQRQDVSWCDEDGVAEIARDIAEKGRIRFQTGSDGTQRVFLDGGDVSAAIRSPEASAGSSTVSAHPAVRRELLGLQRELASRGGVVVEGRDTGTVVFPDADVKFFMTASEEERARRRWAELSDKGMRVSFDETLREMKERDRRDTERLAAPLVRPPAAIDLETTSASIEQVLEQMLRRVEKSLES